LEKEQRLKELKKQASKYDNVPLGLKINIAKLEAELNPEEDGDCIMCSG
jgi:hypothetical protein